MFEISLRLQPQHYKLFCGFEQKFFTWNPDFIETFSFVKKENQDDLI